MDVQRVTRSASNRFAFTAADLAEMADDPGMAVRFWSQDVYAAIGRPRRMVREALRLAKHSGARLSVVERRGVLGSHFTFRVEGTAGQVLPAMRMLLAAERRYG